MRWLVLAVVCMATVPAWAADFQAGLTDIQKRWAEIQYQLPEKSREKAFEDLASDAEALVALYPEKAEPLIWQGIVLSTYAGAKGGLSALGLVKRARASLESALAINASALEGSAYTSLGSLYYQVPGWPIGFGDDDKALSYLQKALAINPDGIDANYFFGDYLVEQGEPERARVYLQKVMTASGRPGREVADAGRKAEAEALLSNL
ncbi:tetratricopeptide repeat protein [Marinobacter sp.]|uniref:tetratricopeptide repeat protein n=1 Tax=Marinobacter sp. TaxID=50741 RepID=UPI0035652F5E